MGDEGQDKILEGTMVSSIDEGGVSLGPLKSGEEVGT